MAPVVLMLEKPVTISMAKVMSVAERQKARVLLRVPKVNINIDVDLKNNPGVLLALDVVTRCRMRVEGKPDGKPFARTTVDPNGVYSRIAEVVSAAIEVQTQQGRSPKPGARFYMDVYDHLCSPRGTSQSHWRLQKPETIDLILTLYLSPRPEEGLLGFSAWPKYQVWDNACRAHRLGVVYPPEGVSRASIDALVSPPPLPAPVLPHSASGSNLPRPNKRRRDDVDESPRPSTKPRTEPSHFAPANDLKRQRSDDIDEDPEPKKQRVASADPVVSAPIRKPKPAAAPRKLTMMEELRKAAGVKHRKFVESLENKKRAALSRNEEHRSPAINLDDSGYDSTCEPMPKATPSARLSRPASRLSTAAPLSPGSLGSAAPTEPPRSTRPSKTQESSKVQKPSETHKTSNPPATQAPGRKRGSRGRGSDGRRAVKKAAKEEIPKAVVKGFLKD